MKKIRLLIALTGLLVLPTACELNPEIYDGLAASNYPTSEDEFLSTVGVAYRGLLGYYDNERYLGLVGPSTDEMIAPTRGRDWFDNGRWIQLASHTWNSLVPT